MELSPTGPGTKVTGPGLKAHRATDVTLTFAQYTTIQPYKIQVSAYTHFSIHSSKQD